MALDKGGIQTPGTGLRTHGTGQDVTAVQAGAASAGPGGGANSNGDTAVGSQSASTRHPAAIWFFFWGEFAERSSYYGMRAILFLYLTAALHYSDTDATPLYSAFKMGCYLLPLLGGLLADHWFGRYWTIVGFSVPYVMGHFVLGFSDPLILGDAIQGMSPERLRFVANML